MKGKKTVSPGRKIRSTSLADARGGVKAAKAIVKDAKAVLKAARLKLKEAKKARRAAEARRAVQVAKKTVRTRRATTRKPATEPEAAMPRLKSLAVRRVRRAAQTPKAARPALLPAEENASVREHSSEGVMTGQGSEPAQAV